MFGGAFSGFGWRPTFWKLAFLGEKAFSGKGGPFGVFAVLGVFGEF